MKSKIALALIGVGGFGELHLSAIRRMEESRLVRLVAVCDPTIGRFPELEAEFRARNVRIYSDYADMLVDESEITAVSIAAPIPFHYRMVKACLARGVFVYLEKPPVPLLSQLDELIAADKGQKVVVGFQMIGAVWSRHLKQCVIEEQLGDVLEIRAAACWPRRDGYYRRSPWAGRMVFEGEPVFDGPATNALAHLIHNIMFVASNRAASFLEPIDVRGELYRARPIESYDVACLRGSFSTGTRFFAALTHATEETLPFQIEIIGSKGWARVTQDGGRVETRFQSVSCYEDADAAMLRSYVAFVGYIKGDRGESVSLLPDTRGYSLATNVMLQSSGGIHTIGEPWVQSSGASDDLCHSVTGLHSVIADCLISPLLFSERAIPWAIKTPLKSIGQTLSGKENEAVLSPAKT